MGRAERPDVARVLQGRPGQRGKSRSQDIPNRCRRSGVRLSCGPRPTKEVVLEGTASQRTRTTDVEQQPAGRPPAPSAWAFARVQWVVSLIGVRPETLGAREGDRPCPPYQRSIRRLHQADPAAPSARQVGAGGSTCVAAPIAGTSAVVTRRRRSTPAAMRPKPGIPWSEATSRTRTGSGTTPPRSTPTARSLLPRSTTHWRSRCLGQPGACRETGSAACTDGIGACMERTLSDRVSRPGPPIRSVR